MLKIVEITSCYDKEVTSHGFFVDSVLAEEVSRELNSKHGFRSHRVNAPIEVFESFDEWSNKVGPGKEKLIQQAKAKLSKEELEALLGG